MLAERACCLSKFKGEAYWFVSGEREQFQGLFNKLNVMNVNYKVINGLDDHKNFTRLVRELKKLVEKVGPEIIHVHTNWQLAIVASIKYLFKGKYKVIYEIHGYRHNYKLRSILAKYIIGLSLYLFTDLIIVQSTFLKRKFRFLQKKIRLLFYGVDEEFFLRYTPLYLNSTKRLIFPGEFRKGKNQDVLIHVIKKYIDKTGDENVELYLPGKGEKLEECKTLTKKLGLENKIFFPGFINRHQMLEHYLMCQYAVIPTNVETFGICIVEPFVLGRVVISRRTGVSEDIIISGETGFLFDTEKELLEILIDILPNKEKSIYIGNNAFEKRDIFRWDDICEKYIRLINDL
jgi:glycosyltransferase involved in cell wall biosynthesis